MIVIRGDIDQETISKTISLSEQWTPPTPRKGKFNEHLQFALDSGGGDVVSSMKLGRYLRQIEADVWIQTNSTCASSCLFLLAGAVNRNVYLGHDDGSRVGVHRPFTITNNTSNSEASKAYRETNSLIKEYLVEMNIPISLLDLMNSVSPGDIKWLTETEYALYFPSSDPVWLDKRYSEIAANKGISKEEYIKRIQRIDKECTKPAYIRGESDQQQQDRSDRLNRCVGEVLDGLR